MLMTEHEAPVYYSQTGPLPTSLVPISQFAPGTQVRITGIQAERELRRRIESMGISAGKVVEIAKKAGESIILRTENFRIAIRLATTIRICAEPEMPKQP